MVFDARLQINHLMKQLSFILVTFLFIILLQSCSRIFSSAGNEASLTDSTFSNRTVVGVSNTPGTPGLINSYSPSAPAITATPNTTGPTPAARDMADYKESAQSLKQRINENEIKKFIRLMANNRLMETQLSLLIAAKTGNSKLSAYAGSIVKDQNLMGEGLKQVAAAKKIMIPDLNISGTDDMTAKITDLNESTADKADKLYIRMMAKEHKNAIEILRQGVSFEDAAVQNFSRQFLPVITAHKKTLESL